MLELKNIKKDYIAGDLSVHALKGVDLKFRKNEFVSILGPSGCGKTTMLNIIGGLDKYTDGDLVINGRSTKDFKDRDWDTYRNHSIGFVFQSYNLIPHQTVLQNVELALTLSGVSKSERKKRAIKALEDVGLSNQLSKKPSEMSGGQMQRVAIARALVNNPDIILADEPTGALDTETSVSVMEILKKISNDRLIIMVTHNPELADKYSSRIINILDGLITGDSNPLSEDEIEKEQEEDNKIQINRKKTKKSSMSFATSFSLSLKNLFTKKGRTILTSFAGSIGIIGIALVISISQGFTNYINDVQEDALSTYPLTIEENHTGLGAIMETFMKANNSKGNHDNDAVYKKSSIYEMMNAIRNLKTTHNDLKSFKSFIEKEKEIKGSKLSKSLSGVSYSYDLDMLMYTKDYDGNIIKSDTTQIMTELLSEFYGTDMTKMMGQNQSFFGIDTSQMMTTTSLWEEMLEGENGKTINNLIKKQYDVVYGEWPKEYNEVVLVLDENNELDDLTLYALGLEPKSDVENIVSAAMNGVKSEVKIDDSKWSYEDICNKEYKIILNSDCYKKDEKTGSYQDLRNSEAGLQYLYGNALNIKVTGIIRPNKDNTSSMLKGSIAYTSKLTRYIINKMQDSEVIKEQLANENTDIITGLPFDESEGETDDSSKAVLFKNFISNADTGKKAQIYKSIMNLPPAEKINAQIDQVLATTDTETMISTISMGLSNQMGMNEDDIKKYLTNMKENDLRDTFKKLISKKLESEYKADISAQLDGKSDEELAALLDSLDMSDSDCVKYYDEVMEFSDVSRDDRLKDLGYIDLDNPSKINLYSSSFEEKDNIKDVIKKYNKDKSEMQKIVYTDYIGVILSSITTIINAITNVLIAFVAISLIVSSIMIGVITLISVQERTKEIGILRALGASKRDVSSMFNAETIIIGLCAGMLGVVVTYIVCIPANIIIHKLTGLNNLSANLPFSAALILIFISVVLTLIAGIIPSRSASKKDPVVALRTE